MDNLVGILTVIFSLDILTEIFMEILTESRVETLKRILTRILRNPKEI